MRDLEQLLGEFDSGAGGAPSPAEIRRRGDRLRRRNRALMIAGSAVAVAVIATPLALLGGADQEGAPPGPADRPARTTVPDDLPIAFELPTSNLDGSPVVVTDEPAVTELAVCGDRVWTPQPTTDVAGARYTADDDAATSRTVAVYADPGAATRALDAIRDGLGAGCGTGDDTYEPVTDEARGVSYRHTSTADDPVVEVVTVERFANALYLEVTDERVQEVAAADRRLRDAMRVFEGEVVPRLEGELVPDASLYAEAVPGPDLLPDDEVVSDLGPWAAVEAGDDAVDPCRPPIDLARLGPSTRYVGRYVAGGGPDDQAVTWVAVAQFTDDAAARAAADRVYSWRNGPCGAPGTSPDDDLRVSAEATFDRSRFFVTVTAPQGDGRTRSFRLAVGVEGRLLTLVSYSAVHDGPDPSSMQEEASDLVEEILGSQPGAQ